MKHSSLRMSLLIKYSEVFPEDPRMAAEFLAPYSRTLNLKMIAVLNSMLQRNVRTLSEQIVSWFGELNLLGLQGVYFGDSRHSISVHTVHPNFSLISRQRSKLLRQKHSNSENSTLLIFLSTFLFKRLD